MENKNFVIECPENLESISQKILDNVEEKKSVIFDFFEISDCPKINVKLFDDLEKYRKCLAEDFKIDISQIPKYSTGAIGTKTIYLFMLLNNDIENDFEKNIECVTKNTARTLHEFSHILFYNLIVKQRKQHRIVWFDEGLAQCLSGQKSELEKDDNFKYYFLNVMNSTKTIPNLNELSHGDNVFIKKGEYNAYDLSFIAVRYMLEVLGKQKVREIIKTEEKLLEVGNTVLKDAFEYFKEKYFTQSKKRYR